MLQRFINFISISLVMVATVQAAAQSSMITTKFNTEADIPTSITRTCMYAGFAAGFVQQVATFGIGVAYSAGSEESLKKAVCTLFLQWPVCTILSVMAHDVLSNKIRYLKKVEGISSEWVYDRIMGHGDSASRHKFLRQYNQLRSGKEVSEQVCEAATIYEAYNELLEGFVKKRAFVGGYIIASALGPIPSFAAAYMLIKLV